MATYFEYRKIDELIEDNCNFYRQQKEFTLDELSQYDGRNGKPAYVAIEGVVYDISNEPVFREVKNIEIIAGKDLTEQFKFYYKMNQIINKTPGIGVLDDGSDIEYEINKSVYRQEKQRQYQLRTDEWSEYDESLEKEPMNRRNKKVTKANCQYQKCISLDTLVELEKVLQETINQVLEMQTKMLKCAGTGTEFQGITTDESMEVKNSGVGGFVDEFFLAGGASGGAGGGLGGASKTTEKVGGFEGTNSGIKLGPGATGGATGGALGYAGTSTTGGAVGGVGSTIGRTETPDDIKIDRLDVEI